MGTFALSITVYLLPTKENKLPFSVSVCSKQTEVCCFHFQLTAKNGSFRFLYIHIYIYAVVLMENDSSGDFP
jgi:hypothetical protein